MESKKLVYAQIPTTVFVKWLERVLPKTACAISNLNTCAMQYCFSETGTLIKINPAIKLNQTCLNSLLYSMQPQSLLQIFSLPLNFHILLQWPLAPN